MKKYKFVEVIWFDAQSHSGYAEDIGNLENWEPVQSSSAGYLIYEDKEKVILGFMLFQDDKEHNLVKHCQMIPKGMIKKIRVIKEAKE